jgi:hypothetical protein
LYQLELVDEVLHHVASLSSQGGPPSSSSSSSSTTTTTKATTSNIKNRKDLIGFLHLRRGDQQSRDECNTELDHVQQYIDCSFSGMDQVVKTAQTQQQDQQQQQLQQLHITVLFASDEQNATYRNAIRNMVLRQQELYSNNSLTLEFVDLEHLLWQLLDQHIQQGRLPLRLANNFVIFQMEWILQWEDNHVDFRLQQRRSMACPNCDNGWIYSLLLTTGSQ